MITVIILTKILINTMREFKPVSEDELRKIVSKLPNKTSPLDPIPTWLLKKCIDTLLPVISSIITNSLRVGSFPVVLREAVITPLIKKPNLNPDLLKNYRPVSNLPTLGKLTLSCLPIYPMPSLKVFYQNMDYYNELNIYQKVLNEFRPNFAETW